MEPLFLGSHPAMDFLNTSLSPGGTPVELIGDGPAFVGWLVSAGLLDGLAAERLGTRVGRAALDDAAREARRFRAWAVDWISRWRDAPRGHYKSEVSDLNRLLARGRGYREAVATKSGIRLDERSRIDTAADLIAIVATQVALLVADERPELVKQCEGTSCTLWFLDRTKAHARRYCSQAVCGNRAKVAAFRDRQRRRPG